MQALSEKYYTDKELHRIGDKYLQTKELDAFDWETTGLNPYLGAFPFASSFCTMDYKTAVYRFDTKNGQANWNETSRRLCKPNAGIIAHNAIFEWKFIKVCGIPIQEDKVIHCTMIQSQLLRNNAPSHAQDYLCWELGGMPRNLDAKVKEMATKLSDIPGEKQYQKVNHGYMTYYQRADAIRCALLHNVQYPYILKNEELFIIYINKMENIKTCQGMEQQGLKIDVNECNKLIDKLGKKLKCGEKEIWNLTGIPTLEINSGDQIADLLYNKYKLPILKYTGKEHKPSVDKDTLFALIELTKKQKKKKLPIILDLIMMYRSYTKGKSTIEGYLERMDENQIIHSTISPNRAKTGRPASEDPNLLNVSKSKALKNPHPVEARRCFRTRTDKNGKPTEILVLVDIKGQELRLAADKANEPELMEIIKYDGDIHHPTVESFIGTQEANQLLKDDPREYKIQREAFKNVGFATIYGASLKKLAETIKKEVIEIRPGHVKYIRRFPRLVGLYTKLMLIAKKQNYITIPFGRDLSMNKFHMATNYYIQGTAAEMMARIENRLRWYFHDIWNSEIKLLITIYDEAIFSIPLHLIPQLKRIMKDVEKIMCTFTQIDVRIDIEAERTLTTWESAKKFNHLGDS